MFKCKTCVELKEQNKYLQGIVDRLLVKNGVTPKVEPGPEPIELDQDKPAEQYGE